MAEYTPQIAASDTGNGNVNAMLAKAKKSITFPSIRARVTSQELKIGKGYELDYTWADWEGQRYAVGDDALTLNRQGIDRHMGAARYGGEHHRFLTAYALARLGIKSGSVDLTLMLPPAMLNENKQSLIEAYSKQPVVITLKGDKKPREWRYESVTVWPEGFAAVGCFMLDASGAKSALAAKLAGEVLLLDCGAYTANVFRLHNGTFNPADLPFASIQNGGGNTHIRLPLLEWVQGGGGDFTAVTVDDLDRVIRLGSVSGDYKLAFGRSEVDLKQMLDYLSQQYANWLANNALDTRFDGLRDINAILIIGGNAPLMLPYLKEWYPDKVIEYTGWREF
ncbi:MAG: ParM/StbA family protein, partial [Chloroflexota bacterium]